MHQTSTQSQENPRFKGRIKRGEVRNPLGGAAGKPFQSFKERLCYWLETKTIDEIRAIVEKPKEWKKLVAIDALVAQRIHQASKDTGLGDFNAIFDRLLGKPAQAITGEDGKPLLPQTDLNELARKTAFLLSMAVLPIAGSEKEPITLEGSKPLV